MRLRYIADGLSAIDNALTIIGEEAAYSDPSLLKKLSGDCWIIDPLMGPITLRTETHLLASL